jgi:hypothetical protein
MSDSQPPNAGPDPDEGWDLEGLLSGENVWLPERMRPVAGTLAALRAAPVRAEWAGEAAARTAFRQIMLASGREPVRSEAGTGDPRTLIMPTRTADGGAHAVTRRRHSHRRPPRRVRWRSTALAGGALGAAAVVIIGGIALAGAFSGGGHPGQPGSSTAVTSTTTKSGGSGPGPGGLEGSAAKEPTASPTSSASGGRPPSSGSAAASERSSLCLQYWAFFAHPESSAEWAAEQGTLQRLSELAGSPWNVPRYCGAYYQWGFAPPPPESDSATNSGAPASQAPGDSQGKNQSEPHSGDGNGKGGAGNPDAGNGSGNNGSGPGGNGPGSGNQSHH